MRRLVTRIAVGLVLVAFLCVYLVGKSFIFGHEKGQPCVDSGECRGNLLRCDTAAECDPGWACAEVGVSNNPLRKEHVCARPAPR